MADERYPLIDDNDNNNNGDYDDDDDDFVSMSYQFNQPNYDSLTHHFHSNQPLKSGRKPAAFDQIKQFSLLKNYVKIFANAFENAKKVNEISWPKITFFSNLLKAFVPSFCRS